MYVLWSHIQVRVNGENTFVEIRRWASISTFLHLVYELYLMQSVLSSQCSVMTAHGEIREGIMEQR
jgi:hypothetical protein